MRSRGMRSPDEWDAVALTFAAPVAAKSEGGERYRRGRFGGKAYDDAVARARIAQAFGRLIRRADDRGVFVVLDRQLPSRLLAAFPEGVPVTRAPLTEAVELTARFLDDA